ncbi:TlpA family protein disulfide reductase [Fulvivirga lutimaris]|uniref:TlpA family protein disulfide reductase n=1 Tax=Fulvivirga lutimaris TaxID=1819566 RepID=UPI00162609BA|nr:TlpA disulfide reductase family protein [Fulvivirga lutimaris]
MSLILKIQFSLIILVLLACQSNNTPSYEEGIAQCWKEMVSIEDLENFIPLTPDCITGHLLPVINETSIGGTPINQEYFKGKITIMNFWFSACAPCMAEIPGFNEIKMKYGTERVNYLAIGRDAKEDIIKVLQYTPWQFDQIADADKLIKDTFKLRWGYPTTFIINEQLEIIHAFSGGSTGEDAFQRIQDQITPILDSQLKQ